MTSSSRVKVFDYRIPWVQLLLSEGESGSDGNDSAADCREFRCAFRAPGVSHAVADIVRVGRNATGELGVTRDAQRTRAGLISCPDCGNGLAWWDGFIQVSAPPAYRDGGVFAP